MNLDEWLSWLERLHPTTIELGLDRVKAVADRLDLDLADSRIVIVGGTNGKGSTVTLLANILQKAGKSVATYMSPHIEIYNERVMIDGRMASDEELCSAFERVEEARQETSLTYFEFGTLCALVHFARVRPDYILLEVGLGGRLDAVNIVEPDLCILTNVALDHIDWLGDTREKIGFEKAGIFRTGKPAIYGESELPDSVQAVAAELGTPLYCQSRQFLWSVGESGSWSWQGVNTDQERVALFDLPLTGINLDNASAVLQALALLEPHIPREVIASGLREARLQGRFERIATAPDVILDVAHNPHAMRNLAQAVRLRYPDCRLHVVIAMLADKDGRDAVSQLDFSDACWYVGELGGERGAPSKILYNHLLDRGAKNIEAFPTVEQAFASARAAASVQDVIIVTGSFLTVSAVLSVVKHAG